MKTLAIIPLRSGSKRLINKNIKFIDGFPLFYYIFKTASETINIDRIIISTDSLEYKSICEAYGCEVLMREKSCSHDHASSESVISDVLGKIDHSEFDLVTLLQATNPLTVSSDINKAIVLLKSNHDLNSVHGCYQFDGFILDEDKLIDRQRTQDKKPRYFESGNFWIVRKDKFIETRQRIVEPCAKIEVSRISSLEIDTQEDLDLIEPVLIKNNRLKYYSYYRYREFDKKNFTPSIDPDGVRRDLHLELENKADDTKTEIKFINSLATEGMNFLDVGCGNGLISSFVSDKYNKYGIDPNFESLQNAKKYISESNLVHSEFTKNIFPKESFDVVLCYHVIEHVEDPFEFISNLKDVIRPGGYLIIATPNFGSPVALMFGEKFRLLHDRSHIRLFTDESLGFFLEDNGFHIFSKDFPFFGTRHFTKENLLRLFDKSKFSPPFYGNIMTFYCLKK